LQVLCEVETSVETLGLTALSHKKGIVTNHPQYQNKGDLTRMLIQDWGIFNFYKSFLNEWLDAFNDATAEGPGICNNKMKLNSKVTTNKKSTRGKKTSKIKNLSTKYVLATINQTSLPSLLEDPKKESIRKRLLTKKPTRKTSLRKRFPKNRLMRNKRKKLTAQERI